jgi:metaxin
MRYEAYISLIDHRIRNAWLFTVYLDKHNAQSVAKKLYIYPTSSNPLARMGLFHQLQQAAMDELFKAMSYIREDELYFEAEKAFGALSTLLGEDDHFFRNEEPSLFDASVFAYTHLLLDESLNWQNTRLVDSLKKSGNLVQHRQRLLKDYFGDQNSAS